MVRRPLPGSPPGPTGRLLGYARVSTEDQATDAQIDELRGAGCAAIYQEHGSGASRARPELARLMREIRPGDVLVVVRLDRLARSVSHLLEVIERLEESGAHFRPALSASRDGPPRVLVHMVEEYARHNGHADLLRERIDGRIGQ